MDFFRPFKTFDYDRSGTLSREEFREATNSLGAALTSEQFEALFAHFDPNDSGGIDYGELMWGFFNRRVFLKRWQLRGGQKSQRQIHDMFHKYDRTGRGALSRQDFLGVLKDLKFELNEFEEKLLVHRFDKNNDGYIDYYEFEAFIRSQEESPPTTRTNQPIEPEVTGQPDNLDACLDQITTMQKKLRNSIPSKYFLQA